MKKIKQLFCAGTILLSSLLYLTGCFDGGGFDSYFNSSSYSYGGGYDSKDELADIKTTVSYKLFEYDPINNITGNEVTDRSIKAHKRYKLIFDADFSESDWASLGNGKLNTKITVKMGDFENEENRAHLTSKTQIDANGYDFTDKGNGVWEASLSLKKNSASIPLENTYFIVGIDSLGNGTNSVDYQPVSISFSSESRSFDINGTSKFSLTLIPIKNDYVWNENNLSVNVGAGATKNNVEITIPKYCNEINLVYWKDETKSKKYGIVELISDDYKEQFSQGKITIILSDYLKEFAGIQKWNDETADGKKFDVYIEYIAVGGINFNDASFGVQYSLDWGSI